MLLFFDMEFTGLHKKTTPISLGIVSEDGKTFYAEFTDYNIFQVTSWIDKNVIENLKFPVPAPGEDYYCIDSRAKTNPIENDLYDSWNTEMNGTLYIINERLNNWLMQFDSIQFVSDVCHYDFVLLIDILTNGGTAIDLAENISAVCHDINMDIARHYHISDREAFDMSREKIMNDLCKTEDIVTGNKHNSLYDAEVIKAIYEEIGYDI